MHGYVPSIADIFRRRLAAWPEQDSLRLFVAVKDVVFETAARVLLGFNLSVCFLPTFYACCKHRHTLFDFAGPCQGHSRSLTTLTYLSKHTSNHADLFACTRH